MSVTGSVALAVAERVERTGGPRAGLVAWRTLASNSTDVEVRGKALLAALRCALQVRDDAALADLTKLWPSIETGVWETPVASLCQEMERAGMLASASSLAGADARRHRTARSLYLHARCLDVSRDEAAAEMFREAIARAEKEGARDIERISRVRRAAILARSWDTLDEALAEALRVDPKSVPPKSRLALARVLLRSPSRFVRAGAIGELDELATGEDIVLAEHALLLAAAWTDRAGDELTPLEADRLMALFGRERATKLAPRAKDIVRVLARIANASDDVELSTALDAASAVAPELAPLHARARDIVRGRYEAPSLENAPPESADVRWIFRWSQLLDVGAALRDRSNARAAHVLRLLASAKSAGEHLPNEILDVAQLALATDDADLRDAAVAIVASYLQSGPSTNRPRRGWVALADTLSSLGLGDLSVRARRAAALAREPGAAASLGTSLAREGWELARAGDRARAIRKLREAKALLNGSTR
jgi:hypothetical protein